MPHFLDEVPFNWSHTQSQELLRLLTGAYNNAGSARFLIQTVGVDTSVISFSGSIRDVWIYIVDETSKQGKLRLIIDKILADSNVGGFHSQLRSLLGTGTNVSHAIPRKVSVAPMQIREAVLSAFPDVGTLQIVVSDVLGEQLQNITVLNQPMTTIVFSLCGWCESNGRLHEFLRAAATQNTGNPKLRAVVESL
jgi:hypothetical protein